MIRSSTPATVSETLGLFVWANAVAIPNTSFTLSPGHRHKRRPQLEESQQQGHPCSFLTRCKACGRDKGAPIAWRWGVHAF